MSQFIKRSSCGCNVAGQGTEQSPFTVHHCPEHAAAPDMLELIRAAVDMIDNHSRGITKNNPVAIKLRERLTTVGR